MGQSLAGAGRHVELPATHIEPTMPVHAQGLTLIFASDRRNDTPVRYSGVAIGLHWAGALLLFCGFGLGLFMTGLEFSPAKFRYYAWHKWIGITVFLVTAARLAWRAGRPPPPLPHAMPPWQATAAQAVQALLYALMLAIPLSGWVYSSATGVSVVYLGLVPLPNLVPKDRELARLLLTVHQALNFTLAVAVVAHVVAALKHQFVDRDGVLARMLPGGRTPP
jgi:cytochrome b561